LHDGERLTIANLSAAHRPELAAELNRLTPFVKLTLNKLIEVAVACQHPQLRAGSATDSIDVL